MHSQAIRAGGLVLAAAVILGGAVGISWAKEEPVKKTEAVKPESPKPEQAAEMEAWIKLNQPGPEHKKLASFAGEWTAVITACMPDGSKIESKGTEKSVVVLDGRFVKSVFEGSMMGVPYTGHGLLGYDNLRKKYVMTWTDSMSTGIMMFEGTSDGKSLTLFAEQKDATGKTEKVKAVTTIIDDNHHTFEMFMILPDDKEVKSMSIDYKRVAK